MSLFGDNTNTLEDALGQQADHKINSIDQVYAKKRRQAISEAGANGRLRSGVSNYTMGDINAEEAGAQGDVYGDLASALGQVPTTDYATSEDDRRNRELARLLASMNGPSTLEEVLGGIRTAGSIASTAAAFA